MATKPAFKPRPSRIPPARVRAVLNGLASGGSCKIHETLVTRPDDAPLFTVGRTTESPLKLEDAVALLCGQDMVTEGAEG
jgi:hypothetical protein